MAVGVDDGVFVAVCDEVLGLHERFKGSDGNSLAKVDSSMVLDCLKSQIDTFHSQCAWLLC